MGNIIVSVVHLLGKTAYAEGGHLHSCAVFGKMAPFLPIVQQCFAYIKGHMVRVGSDSNRQWSDTARNNSLEAVFEC